MRPIVLSTSFEEKSRHYVDALKAVGVDAHEIRIAESESLGGDAERARREAVDALTGASALVLCGGEDVEPWRYGEQSWNETLYCNPIRDAFELALIAVAEERALPTFGVCRGLQILNVHCGGTLWQDLPTQRAAAHPPIPHSIVEPLSALAHEVEATSGVEHPFAQELARSISAEPWVNSRHHQAVKQLGRGLEACALSPDGLIEAFTLPLSAGWWMAAVQWHPENLVSDHEPQRRLWQAFVEQVTDFAPLEGSRR
jgi:putative glutamine amidotransferase